MTSQSFKTSQPLIFYDISSPLEPCSYAPNPSKSRYALSFKNIPFTTKWTDILDIPVTRKGLHCAATRKLDDGSDYYTLPMLVDPNNDHAVIGDSFDIANYLDERFPDPERALFPEDAEGRKRLEKCWRYESPAKDTMFFAPITTNEGKRNGEYALFNLHVDATFTANMGLYGYNLPFNPESAERVKEIMAKRAHLPSWEVLKVEGEEKRAEMKKSMKEGLRSLAELFDAEGKEGPFLMGTKSCYADLIVGGWLNFYGVIMPKNEWEEFEGWYGGVFGRLHAALQEKYWKCD